MKWMDGWMDDGVLVGQNGRFSNANEGSDGQSSSADKEDKGSEFLESWSYEIRGSA